MVSWISLVLDAEEGHSVSAPCMLVAIVACCVTVVIKALVDRVESRLSRQLQLHACTCTVGSDVDTNNTGSRITTATTLPTKASDQAPVTSVIIQVSQTNAPGGPVFVASAEAPLGSSPQPTLVQGHDAAKVINQVLAKVYPSEMNGQIGSVRLLPGKYSLAAPLVIARSGLTLSGSTGVVLIRAQSATSKGHGNGTVSPDPLVIIAASNIVVRDMHLDGAVPGTGSPKMGDGASAGVLISGPLNNVLVENVTVQNVSATAISAVINATNAPTGGIQSGIVVRGCTIDRCGMGGISLAKRAAVSQDSDTYGAPVAVQSMGHQVFGNRISRTGSHAVCLTGVSCSQIVANQMQHVSLYNQVGTFGHGIAVDGNCGNDPVSTPHSFLLAD